ncbi:MAG: hypothetical protein K2W97_06615 [Chthoniobacterales bacterium]|nr:hypothetical protein [Chthoniobacterales bacterium]
MNKKNPSIFLIFVVLLMAPLRVDAMKLVSGKEKEEEKRYSDIAAAVREHKREATAPENTGSGQDNPITQARLANIERVRSQALRNVEKAKKIIPAFADTIEEWHQSESGDTRDLILNRQILSSGAPEAERAQRNEIAVLLQRAAQMEESITRMEQVGIDETWKEVETMAPATIVQEPSPRVRGEQILQARQRENGVQQEAVNTLIRLTQASKTMVCLKAIDFFAPTSITTAFTTANIGRQWANLPLILNDSERPVRLIIPASESQSNYALVTPTIIPAGTRTIVDGVRTTAPTRVPSAAESRQVRTLIMEALEVYCGPKVNELFPDLDRVDTPLMIGEINEIFSKIAEYQGNENQNGTATTEAPQIPASLGDADALVENSPTKESDEAKRLEAQALFRQTNERLRSPNKALAQAAWYAAETVVRGVGFVGGTTAGIKPIRGAVIGATTAAAATFAHAGIIAHAGPGAAFSAGGVTGASVGTIMGHAVGLDEREVQQAIISSCILTLVAVPFLPHASLLAATATLGGVGAVGGALPFTFKPGVASAAQRVWNYYAPGAALEKAKEAWENSSGVITHTLTLMQQTQETDLEAMEALHDFFESFVQVENAASAAQMQCNLSSVSSSSASRSSSPALDVEEIRVNERAITPETLTPTRARDILINQMKLRILYREDLMMRLQNKT